MQPPTLASAKPLNQSLLQIHVWHYESVCDTHFHSDHWFIGLQGASQPQPPQQQQLLEYHQFLLHHM